MTLVYMYRDLLISKEKMESFYRGECYRQVNHLTPTGGDCYKDSITDDLESFYEDIKLGRNPLNMTWTYFISELTEEEVKRVKNKDEKYFRTFKWLNNADVNQIEMNSSSSTSKYVSAYCRRKTISILYGSTEDTIALIKSKQPIYPLLGNAIIHDSWSMRPLQLVFENHKVILA